MLRLGIWLIWLALYQYYIEQICDLQKGKIKRIALWGITGGTALAVGIAPLAVPMGASAARWLTAVGWLVIVLVFFLYVLFYDGAPFRQQWRKALAPGCMLVPAALAESPVSLVSVNGAVMAAFLLLLAKSEAKRS